MRKSKVRDLLFIYYNKVQNLYKIYGLEFHEFIKAFDEPINLLLTDHQSATGHDLVGDLMLVKSDEVKEFIEDEDVYSYGNFSWLDVKDDFDLAKIPKQEIAEICYISRFWEPFSNPFLKVTNNRFVYLSHDDGFMLYLYCREEATMKKIINNAINKKLKDLKLIKKVSPLPTSLMDHLYTNAEIGMLIPFHEATTIKNEFKIPIYKIGDKYNLDDMYNTYEKVISSSLGKDYLIQKEKKWNKEVERTN